VNSGLISPLMLTLGGEVLPQHVSLMRTAEDPLDPSLDISIF
jgi:hypothetical protein